MLNQPAHAMSPFEARPDDFTDWLTQRYPQANDNTIATRHVFGDYCIDRGREILGQLKSYGVIITRVQGIVSNINKLQNISPYAVEQGSKTKLFDSLVIAAGHPLNPQNIATDSQAPFLSPTCSTSLKLIAEQSSINTVGIIGTGASFIDAVRALSHYGYQGNIIAISRHGWLPWRDDKNQRSHRNLPPVDLDNEKVATIFVDLSCSTGDIYEAFFKTKTIISPQEPLQRYLPAFPFEIIQGRLDAHRFGGDISALKTYLYCNPTTPETHDMLTDLISDNCLQIIKGSVERVITNHEAGQQRLILANGKSFVVQAAINSSVYSRRLAAGTLQRQHLLAYNLVNGGLARLDEKTGILTSSYKTMHIVGPLGHDGPTWGCESFRPKCSAAGKLLLQTCEHNL